MLLYFCKGIAFHTNYKEVVKFKISGFSANNYIVSYLAEGNNYGIGFSLSVSKCYHVLQKYCILVWVNKFVNNNQLALYILVHKERRTD